MAKCPPGVFCIENITLLFILVLVVAVLVGISFIYRSGIPDINLNLDNSSREDRSGIFPRPAYSFSNVQNDVLLNPYQAPLRDNRVFPGLNVLSGRVPINVPTQSFDSSYRQVGILTRIGDKEMILPLLGRPLITNRDRWNFYTMSESNNLLKLPIQYEGRKCMSDQGCRDLYTGDVVYVDGYKDQFKVTTYENDSPKYIPYI